ncbi:hypothetical protein [Rickettsia bellii]|uniref:Acylglycerophosphoethanolamine acyltransferase n=1 Tax=Rickettsia bellii str. RML An4 TaxID=1359193 RepID=A0A0F3Q9V0_RICBE|nr:hypothetical protein [Rickettsia bellii]ABV79396.1 hypothetical protein A1I_05345 [Rickettsia bellii OSU 85-389]KJV89323.1 hypothetical protein RBEAN4_0295 [Rickettsia bellii str. RML An4]
MSSTKDSKEQTIKTKIKPNFSNLSSALKKNLQRRKKAKEEKPNN